MVRVGQGPLQNTLYTLHKSFGILILALMVARLINRIVAGAPAINWTRFIPAEYHPAFVQTAAGGDVGEGSVPVVSIERRMRGTAAPRPVFAVDQKDVEPAVAVGVDEGAAGAERLGEPFLTGAAAVMHEFDAC